MKHYALLTVEGQRIIRKEIISSFKLFWDSNPSEQEFALNMDGVVLFPEMIYYMIKNPNGCSSVEKYI
jgi:hypothetical protein